MSEIDDKRELLKLKQGLITESEIIKPDIREKVELHGIAKIDNFFYHYKVPVIITAFFVLLFAFFVYDFLSKDKMDLRIMVMTNEAEAGKSYYFIQDEIETTFESFSRDFNGDGKIHIEMYYADISEDGYTDPNMIIGNNTKIFGEIQSGIAQILIGNADMYWTVLGENKVEDEFIDLSLIYKDNPNIVDKYFYKIKGSPITKLSTWNNCPEDMYLTVRKTNGTGSERQKNINEEYRSNSLELLNAIINS